jgi:NitT/TauT family transport system ATP-binding protein
MLREVHHHQETRMRSRFLVAVATCGKYGLRLDTHLFAKGSAIIDLDLADRIIVMTYRPGTVKRDLRVDLPRPRDPSSAGFNAQKRELDRLVMEEQRRHTADELERGAAD